MKKEKTNEITSLNEFEVAAMNHEPFQKAFKEHQLTHPRAIEVFYNWYYYTHFMMVSKLPDEEKATRVLGYFLADKKDINWDTY